MIFDINRYVVNRPFIQNYYRLNGGDPVYAVSLLAATVGCPVIVLAYYLAESVGFTPGLIKTIQSQIDRGYGIKNGPDNDPFKELNK